MAQPKVKDGALALSAVDAATLNGFIQGTGNNNLVQLDGSGNLPAVDGSALTGIPDGGMRYVTDESFTGSIVTGGAISTVLNSSTNNFNTIASSREFLLDDLIIVSGFIGVDNSTVDGIAGGTVSADALTGTGVATLKTNTDCIADIQSAGLSEYKMPVFGIYRVTTAGTCGISITASRQTFTGSGTLDITYDLVATIYTEI